MTKAAYKPRNKIRFVTAAALFDGHDASINIMRRLLQAHGAEVIHLGHNRSAEEIVDAAIQEDAQGIAVSSYQGGHMEFFKYMYDLLRQKGAAHIKIFGGGGGVIVPEEIEELHKYGINRIFSPEDGRKLGLDGMIEQIVRECDFATIDHVNGELSQLARDKKSVIARLISYAELNGQRSDKDAERVAGEVKKRADKLARTVPIVGFTGTGGAGKSSLTDEVLRRYLADFPEAHIAVFSVDPTRKKTGGALLGDRIRMNALHSPRVYMRSLATRESGSEISEALDEAVEIAKAAGYDLVLIETSGIGQADSAISELVDLSVYVMTSEYGASSQLEKIEMLDYADLVALNKFERRGAEDALRDVKKQVWRNRGAKRDEKPAEMPVYPTIASQFNDAGVNAFYQALLARIGKVVGKELKTKYFTQVPKDGIPRVKGVIPGQRQRYLSEISDSVRSYHKWAQRQAEVASSLYATFLVLEDLGDEPPCRLERYKDDQVAPDARLDAAVLRLRQRYNELVRDMAPQCIKLLADWPELRKSYSDPENVYSVRGKEIRVQNYTTTLSGTKVPKVALPNFSDWGDLLLWMLNENTPGAFPYTAGVFPYKRSGEDPTRMFAGEGPPGRTNNRFHLVSSGQPAARLSTAFDSVTLYGEDPHERPDIYGKVGESGVSITTVEDIEILYAGFDLCAPNNSVSMTINGPAPIILAFFMNAAIRQQARKFLMEGGKLKPVRSPEKLYTGLDPKSGVKAFAGPLAHAYLDPRCFDARWDEMRKLISDAEYSRIADATVNVVRGTVQADILKEDQAQNTCIFSIEFALRMMGDVQQWFIDHKVQNYYSVSISGYHIAEAGANPITQLAFTLANGFTYVEYYRSRGMDINGFAPNLSFFFSNGIDAEYAVIGRVARRIWAIALDRLYGGNDRAAKLKYHIQTSGRSLHAMEIDFNDIRTTLQALYAIYDNCNSLHTNAYDEAITTPTAESVRRALAIQHIINRELGLNKNENPLQGAFIIEALTDLVEEAVLQEFDRLTERGGVIGAMETQYQRGKIQEESMYYEQLKHSGELPIVGINTFLNPKPPESNKTTLTLARATEAEKQARIATVREFQKRHASTGAAALERLRRVALEGGNGGTAATGSIAGNIFNELMDTVQHCSLGQISAALYEVGGQYRRSM
ncbi:MAG: methylmalonyl-CoA mutase family protein [Planctomycetes bacterium]|nr:methylmalonyl-CoA mutase family protein [Planctomycetota bacterium]